MFAKKEARQVSLLFMHHILSTSFFIQDVLCVCVFVFVRSVFSSSRAAGKTPKKPSKLLGLLDRFAVEEQPPSVFGCTLSLLVYVFVAIYVAMTAIEWLHVSARFVLNRSSSGSKFRNVVATRRRRPIWWKCSRTRIKPRRPSSLLAAIRLAAARTM